MGFTGLLLINLVLSASAFAMCEDDHFDELAPIKAISSAIGKKEFLDRPDVTKSPCKNLPPTKDEMLNYLDSLRLSKVQSKEVAGAKLKDDESLIKLFGELHNPDSAKPGEMWRSTKGTKVNVGPCKDVLCSMKMLYGEELGIQLLYMRAKFGFNASHLGVGEGIAWPSEKFGIILAMLNDFPQSMHPVNAGGRFLYIDADGRNGDTMAAEALVHVYRGWDKLKESEKTTSLAHELGHLFAHSRKNSPAWLKLSGWTSTKNEKGHDVWTMGMPHKAVLQYARTNPNEDFAETFFMYRYNGAQLKEMQPEKYQYMKDEVYKGQEFLDQNSCPK